jgi:membrane-bound lytic murein transglycosylase A
VLSDLLPLRAAVFAFALCGCSSELLAQGMRPVTAVAARYSAVSFADLPGWAQDDHAAAFQAFTRSCKQVLVAAKAGNKGGPTPPPPALLAACDDALALAAKPAVSATTARSFFESHFLPHRVEHRGASGLLTGYYEPTIDGSRTRTGRYQTPLYRRPPELVNIVEESMRGASGGALTHGRQSEKGVVPFATRAEIEQGALKGRGLELVYLANPVDAFFMQIQGSGRVKFADGTSARISYDGKNGHPYTSIGRHLIDTGHIQAASMSLDALGGWLKADPGRGQRVMWQNKSYVFFRELQGEEAKSALGVLHIPLTAGRSLAVDAGFHAIGIPIYIDAPTLIHAGQAGGFNRLMIAQDVGSAIKGPERGDVYFGAGDAAGKLAGVTKHPGRFHVLLPHPKAPLATSKFEDAAPVAAMPAATALTNARDP